MGTLRLVALQAKRHHPAEFSDEEVALYLEDAENLQVRGYYSTVGAAQTKGEDSLGIADLQACIGINKTKSRQPSEASCTKATSTNPGAYDVFNDLQIWKVDATDASSSKGSWLKYLKNTCKGLFSILSCSLFDYNSRVHHGFYSQYHALRAGEDLEKGVVKLLQEHYDHWRDSPASTSSPYEPMELWITGHSLGGALATYCTYRFSEAGVLDSLPRDCRPKITMVSEAMMVTFAAPRVGNDIFRSKLNETSAEQGEVDGDRRSLRMLRVVSDGDFIPRVPPTFWPFLYYHPGDLVTLPAIADEKKAALYSTVPLWKFWGANVLKAVPRHLFNDDMESYIPRLRHATREDGRFWPTEYS
eukprot:scaffold7226_cov387-Prasinococcus_capsulatus_cf.AAC.7